MPYIVVENFGGGMDVRRSSAAAPGGTMRLIENAFVNKGGEIEKRKAWVLINDEVSFLSAFWDGSGANGIVGPYPSFNRNAVLFSVNTSVAALPSAAGPWAANGGGRLFSDQFGFFPDATVSTGAVTVCGSTAAFAGEMILTYMGITGNLPGNYAAVNRLATVAAGDVIPTSAAAISGRTGSITPTAGSGDFTISTISANGSAVYAGPNEFSLFQSQTGAPEIDTGTGYGQFDIRPQASLNGRPVAVARYFSQLAVFCENGIQFWNIDPDPAQWSFDRSIDGEALLGPRAVLPFGSNDILYLTTFGIRSLRARDSSNFAVTTDIGSPIDEAVMDALSTDLTAVLIRPMALATILRDGGNAIFFVGNSAFVLSRYPSANVVAWTVWDIPAGASFIAQVADACPLGDTICIRNVANQIYAYGLNVGGAATYDATEATVTTHYFGVEQPYTEKVWRSIDLACEGTWTIEYSIDPRNEEWVSLGSVTGDTHLSGGPQIDVSSPLMAFRFKTTSASAAKLSQFAIHYDTTEIKA